MRTVMLGPVLSTVDKKKMRRFSSPDAFTRTSHLIVAAQTDVLGGVLFTYPIPCRHYGGYCIKECIHLALDYGINLVTNEHHRRLTCKEEGSGDASVLGCLYEPRHEYTRESDVRWVAEHPLILEEG